MERSLRHILSVSSVTLVVLVLVFASTIWTTRARYSVLFVMLSLIISTLARATKADLFGLRGKWAGFVSIAIVVISIAASIYFYSEYVSLLYRASANTTLDFFFGGLILIPIFLLIWKEAGGVLAVLIGVFLLYAHFGKIFPGLLFHKGLSIGRIIETEILSFEGIYGFISQVVATWVAIFIVYAGLLQGFGALEIIMKICLRVGKRYQNALPQIPVITSMIFGSFSGAAAANVAGTGSFTIPLLQRFGLRPQYAGAIESVASTGGQLMPPIMGATAFLMSAILGEPYLKIMLVGFIPAFLLYMSVGFSVYLISREQVRLFSEEKERGIADKAVTWADITALTPMVVSLIVLFVYLSYFKMPVMRSALFGILTFLVTQFIYELSRHRSKFLGRFVKGLLSGAMRSAIPAASIGVVGAAMGLMIKTLTVTALAPKLSFLMVDLAHGSLPLLLVLILVVCLLFGSALATLAVYVLVVFLAAPALAEMGIPELVGHFIIFYFGALAMITPPVAPAVLVASGIAQTSFMKTAFESLKLGMPILLLPLAFVNFPELIVLSSETIKAFIFVGLGLLLFSYGAYSPDRGLYSYLIRLICLSASGVILLYPAKGLHIYVTCGILAMLALSALRQKLQRRKA
jgi:TRAP transporter 4TM/12TM fusion protein